MRLSKRARLRMCAYFVAGLALLWLALPQSSRHEVTDAIRYVIISWHGGDALDLRMKKLAPSAIDCGRVRVRANPEPATRCALAAFAAKKTFHIRYDMQGIDSDVAIGLVGTRNGSVTALLFDGDPTGGGGTSPSRQRVGEKQCPSPVVLFRSPNGRINCFPPDPTALDDIMSPTWEPY